MKITIRVAGPAFRLAPTFRRGVVVGTALDNTRPDPELERMLADIVIARRAAPIDISAGLIAEWEAAHRASGSNPNRFPPAHKALLKRAQRPEGGVPFVNKVVACMNIVSLRHIMPVGGDDLDRAAFHGECLELRAARGDERFSPLGEPGLVEAPNAGEMVYVVGGEIMCRRWNWRNGDATRISEDTRAIVVNTDALGAGSAERAVAARDELAGLLESRCGATIRFGLLSPDSPEMSLQW